jgi:hypothetical protein
VRGGDMTDRAADIQQIMNAITPLTTPQLEGFEA